MKLLLKLLVAAAFAQISLAVHGFTKNGVLRGKRLNREPPLDKFAPFADIKVEEKWILQKLDHFNQQDERTWEMRYLENNNYLQKGGPIFIYVGGEWTVTEGWLKTGHMHDMARDLNGTMFYTEHRYYGNSHPTEDLTVENLRFLNVDQALADLAHFITHIKQTIPEVSDSGVILVGASYSATMVTWFLQKYPHLANGGWSSSAPLEAKVDFIEYKEVVTESLKIVGGENCTNRIRSAFEELEQLIANNNTAKIEELFHFCHPLDLSMELDVWSFFSDTASPFSALVQYHREASTDIQRECNLLNNNGIENDLEALANWTFYRESEEVDFCYDHRYSTSIEFFNGTEWDDLAASLEIRQWYYQTCAEFGWFQSSGSDNIIFGSKFPVNLSLQLCHDLYGGIFSPETVQKNVDRTNVIYGGLNPSVHNVYSTHGELDPWRSMGVQEDINEFSPTVILPLESHCSDLYSHRDTDTPEMKASRERISQLVLLWLGYLE